LGAPSNDDQQLNSPITERQTVLAIAVPEAPGVQIQFPSIEAVGTDALRSALAYLRRQRRNTARIRASSSRG